MVYAQLFYEFFKTGIFAVGGGLATIPFLKQIAVRYPWFTLNDLSDMIAVSEATPGPVGINMATYAGNLAGGVLGAVIATLSLVLPSIIIITIIAGVLDKFRESKLVNSTFYGLRPAVVGLIGGASWSLFTGAILNKDTFINYKAAILLILVIVLQKKFKKLHPVVFIASSAVIGIIFKF